MSRDPSANAVSLFAPLTPELARMSFTAGGAAGG